MSWAKQKGNCILPPLVGASGQHSDPPMHPVSPEVRAIDINLGSGDEYTVCMPDYLPDESSELTLPPNYPTFTAPKEHYQGISFISHLFTPPPTLLSFSYFCIIFLLSLLLGPYTPLFKWVGLGEAKTRPKTPPKALPSEYTVY